MPRTHCLIYVFSRLRNVTLRGKRWFGGPGFFPVTRGSYSAAYRAPSRTLSGYSGPTGHLREAYGIEKAWVGGPTCTHATDASHGAWRDVLRVCQIGWQSTVNCPPIFYRSGTGVLFERIMAAISAVICHYGILRSVWQMFVQIQKALEL